MQIERADNFMRSLGVEAYRVGGSVRDEILGRPAKDADYMVRGIELDDLGDLMKAKGGLNVGVKPLRLRDGRQAGWRVIGRGYGLIEVVLPRMEVSTGPGHRDFEIVVDPRITVDKDALRRDFTFNALYKIVHDGASSLLALPNGTVAENLIDPLGGVDDLIRQQVRVTHADSFRDDPLRTLRALRFVSTLGYDLSYKTYALMAADAECVTGLTANGYASGTIYEEMSRILMGDNVAKALRLARDAGVLAALFPELAPMLGFAQESRYHDRTTDEHTFMALDVAAKVDAPLRVRWALLFHDAGKPASAWIGEDGRKHYYASKQTRLLPDDGIGGELATWNAVEWTTEDHQIVGERLWREAVDRLTGVPKDVREAVATLIRNHMVSTTGKFRASKIRRMRVVFGDELMRDLLMHRACDVSGKGKPDRNTLERIARMEAERQRAQAQGIPSTVRDLEVGGRDAVEVGLRGPSIGRALEDILDQVATQPSETTLSYDWQKGRLVAWAA